MSVNISRCSSVTHLSPGYGIESNHKNRVTISSLGSTQITHKGGRNGLNLISNIGVENTIIKEGENLH